jgi:hypothetical protein
MNFRELRTGFAVTLGDLLGKRGYVSGEGLDTHLHASVSWLLQAQAANADGGVSAYYDLLRCRWAPSYPETTGYIIPTLLDYACRYESDTVRQAALRMADYELSMQLPDGGFPGFEGKATVKSPAVAFDTGQIMFGLLAAYEETGNNRYADAARRAGDWLVANQSKDGCWNDYLSQGTLHAIDARVSWALLCLSSVTNERQYQQSACRQLDWILCRQSPSGWIEHCSFDIGGPSVVHTIAYAVEGLLESGILVSAEKYIQAAQKGADVLLGNMDSRGYLAGAYNQDWKPAVSWSCLTGLVQMASVWLRLFDITGNPMYREGAQSAIKYVAATQRLRAAVTGVQGGIAGSSPIYGSYMRFKYPNWAAKFFADAVMNCARDTPLGIRPGTE